MGATQGQRAASVKLSPAPGFSVEFSKAHGITPRACGDAAGLSPYFGAMLPDFNQFMMRTFPLFPND